MRMSRLATIAWGIAQIAVALGAQWIDRSVLDAGLLVLSFAAGPVLGAFLTGVLTTRVGSHRHAERHARRDRRRARWAWWTDACAWTWFALARRDGHRWGRARVVARASRGAPMAEAFDAAAEILLEGVLRARVPGGSVEVGRIAGPVWRRAFGDADLRSRRAGDDRRDDLRSRVADQGHRHDDARDARRGRRGAEPGRQRPRLAAGVARSRSRDGHDPRSAGACLGSAGVPAVLPRSHRPRRVRSRRSAACRSNTRRDRIAPTATWASCCWGSSSRTRAATGPGPAGVLDPAATLAAQFRKIASFLTSEPLTFNPPRPWRERTAPTEIDAWRGRLLTGEVHDENTWALGGAAGHAGLFGTASAVGAFARAVLRTIAGETRAGAARDIREFIRRTAVPGSSRALGWDTMLPDLVVRDAPVADRDRPHRVYRHLVVDRLGAGSLHRPAHQPGPSNAGERAPQGRSDPGFTMRSLNS